MIIMADVRKLKPVILKWEGGFVNGPSRPWWSYQQGSNHRCLLVAKQRQ